MKVRIYMRPAVVVWLGFTFVGTVVSVLSIREMRSGIVAIKAVALRRPHAEDVLRMANRNIWTEYGRLTAQGLFLLVGLLSLLSRPRVQLGKPRVVDLALPWIIVAVESILVANSVNEYMVSQTVLKRRAAAQRQSASVPETATLRTETPNRVR